MWDTRLAQQQPFCFRVKYKRESYKWQACFLIGFWGMVVFTQRVWWGHWSQYWYLAAFDTSVAACVHTAENSNMKKTCSNYTPTPKNEKQIGVYVESVLGIAGCNINIWLRLTHLLLFLVWAEQKAQTLTNKKTVSYVGKSTKIWTQK